MAQFSLYVHKGAYNPIHFICNWSTVLIKFPGVGRDANLDQSKAYDSVTCARI